MGTVVSVAINNVIPTTTMCKHPQTFIYYLYYYKTGTQCTEGILGVQKAVIGCVPVINIHRDDTRERECPSGY